MASDRPEPDWDIIDDTPTEPAFAPDEDRLSPTRIRAVLLERRAADRARQWASGRTVFFAAASITLGVRAAGWLVAATHIRWAIGAVIFAVLLLGFAYRAWCQWRVLRAKRVTDEGLCHPSFDALPGGKRPADALEEMNH